MLTVPVSLADVPSEFVTISLFLHGAALPILPLYLDTFFSMPVNRADGRQLSWQEVSRKLDEDLVGFAAVVEHEGKLSLSCATSKYTEHTDESLPH